MSMKFREDTFNGFQVTERTQFVTDRRKEDHGKNNNEPRFEKTGFLHMRKQRRRSAAQ